MTGSASDLARLGLAVADVMERNGSPSSAGAVRQLAALVVDQSAELERLRRAPVETACRRCGAPVEQPATGRRRLFCSKSCRQADHRDATRRIGSMAS